ncbi:hypothetical protein HPP92_020358 [Vanilla planifolia]|uniref:Uncharacterized protein n=1 Tax=Vanilla planifolia TaxID=51239 RepID=A0A835UIE5_VANPL|nr:hypothetical protein HPP92_020358 [Vanilla planifolia]
MFWQFMRLAYLVGYGVEMERSPVNSATLSMLPWPKPAIWPIVPPDASADVLAKEKANGSSVKSQGEALQHREKAITSGAFFYYSGRLIEGGLLFLWAMYLNYLMDVGAPQMGIGLSNINGILGFVCRSDMVLFLVVLYAVNLNFAILFCDQFSSGSTITVLPNWQSSCKPYVTNLFWSSKLESPPLSLDRPMRLSEPCCS